MGRTGVVLFVGGVLVVGLNRLAAKVFPEQWGGANIGGGMIEMVAIVVGAIGLVLLLVAQVRKSRR